MISVLSSVVERRGLLSSLSSSIEVVKFVGDWSGLVEAFGDYFGDAIPSYLSII